VIRVFLPTGGHQDFDAEAFTIGAVDNGRNQKGALKLWKLGKAGGAPTVVVFFASGGWLGFHDTSGHFKETIGFQPPADS
jgi:hypothetical protein